MNITLSAMYGVHCGGKTISIYTVSMSICCWMSRRYSDVCMSS